MAVSLPAAANSGQYGGEQEHARDEDGRRYCTTTRCIFLTTGIAGLSVAVDSLSAIEYVRVRVLRDTDALTADYTVDGWPPRSAATTTEPTPSPSTWCGG